MSNDERFCAILPDERCHCGLRRLGFNDDAIASLERVNMVNSRLSGADVSGARIYGISAWDLQTDATTIQCDLVVSPSARAIGHHNAPLPR
jgi:hypothetical protein